MKVVQICGTIEGAGITRYIIETNIALKMAGYDVDAYECTLDTDFKKDNAEKKNQVLEDTKILDYSDECIANINSADLVFVHQIIPKKASNEAKQLFRDLFINRLPHPKKVIFFNDHSTTTMGFSKFYGGEWLKDEEFLNAFDHYAIHCDTNTYMRNLRNTVGSSVANSKYVNIHHTYFMDPEVKNKWINPREKHKRISYIGRWHTIKHPEQMLELNRYCRKNNSDIELEMRGIVRLIGYIYVPGLFYDIDPKKKGKESIIGPSSETDIITNSWKKERGIDVNDQLIHYKHDKMQIFGEYKRVDGLNAIKWAAFGGEFYHLKYDSEYGDNLEYAMHEIIEYGTIGIFDYHALESIHLWENGKRTNKTLLDLDIAIGLKLDLSNIDQVISKVEYLYSHPDEYEKMRNRAYNALKKHTDPVSNINTFIEKCMKD